MKRKILILTNYCGVFTGFGRNIKELLSYLYRKYGNQYEFILAAAGQTFQNPDFARWPWEVHGVIPNNSQELGNMVNDQGAMRFVAYGGYAIEMLVHKYKPDVILAIEDEWGVNFIKDKEFFNHIPTVFWVTLDSLPILDKALDTASKTPYYWTWSRFAETNIKKVDPEKYKHVVTQYPCFDTNKFCRLDDKKILEIKQRYNLPEDAFIVGFVFRNQLRKLIPRLIEGYSLFKQQNPHIKHTYLYTHTFYHEDEGSSWNIPKLCEQYNVPKEEVLCTYVCRATKKYFVMSFAGKDLNNPITGEKGSLITANVAEGVSEEDLNEIYNLFDLYMHPATSGACEMPCVEAALTEKIVAVSNYSFGEDIISLNKGSINIDFNFYTEVGSMFLKSNQKPQAIADIIFSVYSMDKNKRRDLEKLSRQWALENYSTAINAEKIIELISKIPQHNWDFIYKKTVKNPDAQVPSIEDNATWVKRLYKDILDMTVEDSDSGFQSWMQNLAAGQSRSEIEKYFREVANKENAKIGKQTTLLDLLDETGRKRFLLVAKESIGDILMITSLFKSFSEQNPNTDFYVATDPQYFEIFDGNPYVYKVLPYHQIMENEIMMTGRSTEKGPFDGYCHLTVFTQRQLNYLTNNNLALNLK